MQKIDFNPLINALNGYRQGMDRQYLYQEKQKKQNTQEKRRTFGNLALQLHSDRNLTDDEKQVKWDSMISRFPGYDQMRPEYKQWTTGGPIAMAEAGIQPTPFDTKEHGLRMQLLQKKVNAATAPKPPSYDHIKRGAGGQLVDVRTGRAVGPVPVQKNQLLTNTDKKEITEVDGLVLENRNAIQTLTQMENLSPKANSGWFAETRGVVGANFGTEAGKATMQLDNLTKAQALNSLKATFGAAPTEGERKILLDIQGSSSQPHQIRMEIYRRGKELAAKRLRFNMWKAQALRDGSYYNTLPPEFAEYSQSNTGSGVANGQTNAPQIGAVKNGYRYRGGDPASPESWEAAQ